MTSQAVCVVHVVESRGFYSMIDDDADNDDDIDNDDDEV